MKKALLLLVLVFVLLLIIVFGWMGLGGKKIPEMKPTIQNKVVAPVKKAVKKAFPAKSTSTKKTVKNPVVKVIPKK
jgi:uncharacterized protein (UPF0333 family)